MRGGRAVASHRWGSINGYKDAKRERKKLIRAAVKRKMNLYPIGGMALRSECASHFPIHRLPQEILAEVFVQCLPEVDLWPLFLGRLTQCVAPLLICNVCSSWRELALSEPRLWQTLYIHFKHLKPESKKEDVIASIHTWIGRSGVLPLTLSVRAFVVYNDLDDLPEMVEAVLGALIPYASRWEHFHFDCVVHTPATFPQLGYMPYLRSFSWRGYPDNHKLQISCPRLTKLCWPLPSTISSVLNLPWHQLTHIALRNLVSTNETLLLIQSCQKLMDLEIKPCEDDDSILERLPRGMPVINNSLRRLIIPFSETYGQLFKRLTLPALIELSLDFESSSPHIHKTLLEFLTRSRCKLNSLNLEDCEFDDAMLLEWLEHDSCASLFELCISNDTPIITDTVLFALTSVPSPSGVQVLLPKLKHFRFHMCLGGSPGTLGMMLLSRCVLSIGLRTVSILCGEIAQRDLELIGLTRSLGLIVTFRIVGTDNEGSEEY